MGSYDQALSACEYLQKRIKMMPSVGIICGSGLGRLAERIEKAIVVPYSDIAQFPKSTVVGHKGNFVLGCLGGKNVIVMQGRFHPYEGYTMQQVTLPIRVMKLLGCEYLIVTNATGGIHPNYNVGDLMVVKDHISMPSLAGISPLCGPNDERFGPRFPALSRVYSKDLRDLTLKIAKDMGISSIMHEGVYICCCGPNYDTPAEANVLRLLGANVAGMSTTHETIVAHHAGMKVLAISLVTNREILENDREEEADHEEVLATSLMRSETVTELITRVLAAI